MTEPRLYASATRNGRYPSERVVIRCVAFGRREYCAAAESGVRQRPPSAARDSGPPFFGRVEAGRAIVPAANRKWHTTRAVGAPHAVTASSSGTACGRRIRQPRVAWRRPRAGTAERGIRRGGGRGRCAVAVRRWPRARPWWSGHGSAEMPPTSVTVTRWWLRNTLPLALSLGNASTMSAPISSRAGIRSSGFIVKPIQSVASPHAPPAARHEHRGLTPSSTPKAMTNPQQSLRRQRITQKLETGPRVMGSWRPTLMASRTRGLFIPRLD